MPWAPGRSGNPKGRAPGTGKIDKLRAALAKELPDVLAALVAQAKAGDTGAIRLILERTPVPVIPMALRGLWGSFFSRDPNKGVFRRLWSRVTLVAGAPLTPEEATQKVLRERVIELRGQSL